MTVRATKTFVKHIKVLPKSYRLKIDNYVVLMSDAADLSELPFIEALRGYKNYFKIRVGYLRIGLHIEGNIIQLDCVLPRGDVYKNYPPA